MNIAELLPLKELLTLIEEGIGFLFLNKICASCEIFLYLSLQVKYKCDVDLWTPGPSNCRQTLLHRAIDENNEAVACFLIKR